MLFVTWVISGWGSTVRTHNKSSLSHNLYAFIVIPQFIVNVPYKLQRVKLNELIA